MGCSWPMRAAEAKASHPVSPQSVVPNQTHLSATVALPLALPLALAAQALESSSGPTLHFTWQQLHWFYTQSVLGPELTSSHALLPALSHCYLSPGLWYYLYFGPFDSILEMVHPTVFLMCPVSLKCWMQFSGQKAFLPPASFRN